MSSKEQTNQLGEIRRLKKRIAELESSEVSPAFRSIAEHVSDNIMLLDTEGRIRFINWTVPDLTEEQVQGRPVYEFVPEQYRSTISACLKRVLETRKPDRYETLYVAENGETSFWESRVGAVIRDDEVVGLVSISSNVTERRRAAADRDALFNLALDMLCVASVEGYFLRMNPAFEKTLGYSLEELQQEPFIEFVHPDDRSATLEAVRRLRAGEEVLDFENRYRRKDGQYRWFSWRAVADSKRKRLYSVARDITDAKAADERRRHSQRMEAVGQLAGGIAHDFNNLLLAILVNADFVLEELEPHSAQTERLEEIKRAGERAADLTRQLLAFSRRQPMRPQVVELNHLIESFLKILSRLIPATVELQFKPGAQLESIRADPSHVEQVLLNFCINARDAMPQGGTITIATQNPVGGASPGDLNLLARPGRYVILSVSDTGVGLTPEAKEHLWEPFFTTKPAGEGTGLGLSTVYGIIQQHEGFVQVDSELGRGTTFKVYLPVAEKGQPRQHDEVEGPVEGGRETILIAEDEELVRNVVARVLRRAGYRVLVAHDGEEAVSLFERYQDEIRLVLLDVVMPKLGGLEAYAKIQGLKRGVPALFSSGYSHHAPTSEAALGPERMIAKPYEPQSLLRRIRAELDTKR